MSPDDYVVLTQNLHFINCENSESVHVDIVNDNVVEDLVESFFMTLERAPGLMSRITLGPARVDITIIDNDGRLLLVYWYNHCPMCTCASVCLCLVCVCVCVCVCLCVCLCLCVRDGGTCNQ